MFKGVNIPYPTFKSNSPLDIYSTVSRTRESRMGNESNRRLKEAQIVQILDRVNKGYYNDSGMPPLARLWHRISTLEQNPDIDFNESMRNELSGYKNLYNLLTEHQQSMTERNRILTKTQEHRALSPESRLIVEQEQASQGQFPSASSGLPGKKIGTKIEDIEGNNIPRNLPLSDKQIETIDNNVSKLGTEKISDNIEKPFGLDRTKIITALKNSLAKKELPTATIKRLHYADTIESILPELAKNFDSVLYYTGPKGQARYLEDNIKKITSGETSEMLKKYRDFEITAHSFASNITPFWTQSVAPSVRTDTKKLTNPIGFFTTPDEAKAKMNAILKVFNLEEQSLLNIAQNKPTLEGKASEIILPETESEKKKRMAEGLELPPDVTEEQIQSTINEWKKRGYNYTREQIIDTILKRRGET